MKTLIIDLVGLSGFGLLVAGIYQQHGAPVALMFGGSGMLLFALMAAWRGKRAT